ncbi:MAG: MATE family efflux transporter, partial [Lachnospiraceae bacterium]|nr:MATE family efflux transporter [Lachnospiraceae bacterium]
KSKSATVLAGLRSGFCFLPLILILPGIIGLTGVEISQAAADVMTCLISIPFMIQFMKEMKAEL